MEKYPYTHFSNYNLPMCNGAREYLIYRHIGPGNAYCAGGASKTRWSSWSATVTNRENKRREFEAPRLSELKAQVRAFMDN